MWAGANSTAAAWGALLAAWPYSDRALFAVGFSVLLEAVTIVVSLFFVGLERFRLCQSWRVEPHPSISAPPPALVREALRDHVLNALLLRPVSAFFSFAIFRWCGMEMDAASLPSLVTVAWQVFVCMLVDDAYFYWTHRALHIPWLYKRFHKQHHRFRFTHVLASEFAHPVEDISNVVGTMLGPWILGTHMSVTWLYGAIKLAQTIESHSGYVVPFPFSPWSLPSALGGEQGRHEFHHSRNLGNFGGFFNWWDVLCSTDTAYEEWRAAGCPPLTELVARAAAGNGTATGDRGGDGGGGGGGGGAASRLGDGGRLHGRGGGAVKRRVKTVN